MQRGDGALEEVMTHLRLILLWGLGVGWSGEVSESYNQIFMYFHEGLGEALGRSKSASGVGDSVAWSSPWQWQEPFSLPLQSVMTHERPVVLGA